MRIRMSVLTSMAVILGCAVGSRAQERPNGFFLLSPAGVSSGYDDKFLAGSRVLDDAVTIVTAPDVAWLHSTHRTMFSADYKAEFDLFSQHNELDAWNHNATMRFVDQLSSRLSLDLGESFLSTTDPTRQLVNSLLLLPMGRYQEHDFYTRLVYRLDYKTKVSARFDNAYTSMSLPSDLSGRLDRLSFAGTLSVDHTLDRHQSLSGSYAYLYVHSLQPGPGGVDNSVHNVDLGYIYTVNPGLEIRLFGGLSRSDQSSFTGAAGVDKKFGDLWVSAGYQRYVAFFGGFVPTGNQPVGGVPFAEGLAPNSVYNVASVRAWGNITKRVGLEGTVQRALNGVTRSNRGIKSVIVQLRADYKLTDRLSAFVRTEFYGQNISEFSPFPMSRRRYFGGIEYALTRPPELASKPDRHRPGSSQSDTGESARSQEKQ
jgi:hypothetical protein